MSSAPRDVSTVCIQWCVSVKDVVIGYCQPGSSTKVQVLAFIFSERFLNVCTCRCTSGSGSTCRWWRLRQVRADAWVPVLGHAVLVIILQNLLA